MVYSARYSRNRTRFVSVPTDLNYNAGNPALLNAALTAGLFPKILSIDPSNGQMRTITNNQQASFHPSSVNFGRKTKDLGTNHLAYFTIMWVPCCQNACEDIIDGSLLSAGTPRNCMHGRLALLMTCPCFFSAERRILR